MAPAMIKFSGQQRELTGRRVWRFDLARIVPAPGEVDSPAHRAPGIIQ